MEKKNSNIIISILMILILPFLMISCEEEESPATETIDRLFSPVLFTADVSENIVTFSWVPIKGATYYFEVSKDSLMFLNNLQVFQLEESKKFTLENLSLNTRYSARIKAISKIETVNDSKFTSITFMTLP